MTLRMLFLGENWYGSCARACCYALRRLGNDVKDIDAQTVIPQVWGRAAKLIRRVFMRQFVREYNGLILDTASAFAPDVLLAFKAAEVEAGTLRELRKRGVRLYNFYPDTSAFAHGPYLAEALPEYDCVFFTKRFWDEDVRQRIALRESAFVRHGYDPEIHRPWGMTAEVRGRYGSDVGVIATCSRHKVEVLSELVSLRPSIDLRIWGNQWTEKCTSGRLKKYIQGVPVEGSEYAKALGAIRVNLAVMFGVVPGASRGDETTTRTYEIPACGGFMLHERSDEVLQLFEEGKEMACFGSVKELAEKIDYYLANPEEREAIAAAGYSRCVPAYSYDNRMAEIITWHEARYGEGRPRP